MLSEQESRVAVYNIFVEMRELWFMVMGDMTKAIRYGLLDAWNCQRPEVDPKIVRAFYIHMEGEQKIRDWYEMARFSDPMLIEAIAHCQFCPLDIVEDIFVWQRERFIYKMGHRNPNPQISKMAVAEIKRRERAEMRKKESKW